MLLVKLFVLTIVVCSNHDCVLFFFISARAMDYAMHAQSLKYKAEPGHYCQLGQTLSDGLQ